MLKFPLMTTQQVANFLGVSRQWVVELIQKGDLKPANVQSRGYLIPIEEVEKFIEKAENKS